MSSRVRLAASGPVYAATKAHCSDHTEGFFCGEVLNLCVRQHMEGNPAPVPGVPLGRVIDAVVQKAYGDLTLLVELYVLMSCSPFSVTGPSAPLVRVGERGLLASVNLVLGRDLRNQTSGGYTCWSGKKESTSPSDGVATPRVDAGAAWVPCQHPHTLL
jgi:hypothetical protein